MLLLPAERGRGLPRRLGLSVSTRGVSDPAEEVPGLAVLVDPHSDHHRRPANPRDQRPVSFYSFMKDKNKRNVIFIVILRFLLFFYDFCQICLWMVIERPLLFY